MSIIRWLDDHFTDVCFWLCVALAAAAIMLLPGCSVPMERQSVLEQHQRESIAAKTTADIVDRTISTPAPTTVEVPQDKGRDPIKVTVAPTQRADRSATTSAGEASYSAASGRWSSSVSLPWAIAAALFGLSLILIAIGAWMVLMLLRRSAAIRAAWATADEFLARGVGKVRAMAQAETDPERANLLNSIVAGLESDRADLNRD